MLAAPAAAAALGQPGALLVRGRRRGCHRRPDDVELGRRRARPVAVAADARVATTTKKPKAPQVVVTPKGAPQTGGGATAAVIG
jgi:hypothetical protein